MAGVARLLRQADNSINFENSLLGERLRKLSEAMVYIAEGYRKRSTIPDDVPGGCDEAWSGLVRDARELLAGQYMELAGMVREITQTAAVRTENAREKYIRELLSRRNLKIKEISLLETGSFGLELHVIARALRQQLLIDEIAAYISAETDVCFVPKEGTRRTIGNDYGYFVFRQKEKYALVTGAVRAAKNAGEPSGDNYSVIAPGYGEAAIILSDGMGSGHRACRESGEVVELIERFLRCGFRSEGIVSLISSVLMLGTEAGSYSTLDMCLVNLFKGELRAVKSGASLTFIKHEDWVETISASGLPLGILTDIKPEITTKKLYHGDTIVVLSDGVLDGIPVDEKEKLLQDMIRELPDQEPKELASSVLMSSLRKNFYEPMDDMTVVAGRLCRI